MMDVVDHERVVLIIDHILHLIIVYYVFRT